MVTVIRLYIEGDSELRPGFMRFFARQIRQAGERGIRFDIRLTGSTEKTIGAFLIANHQSPGNLNICLIDSDRYSDFTTLWQELLQRREQHPRWRHLNKPSRKQGHWMIQAMEAWLLADRECLRQFYGAGMREASLPRPTARVEGVSNPKQKLKNATRDTQKGSYHETKHAPELLKRINVEKVRQAAPACERLLRTLEGELA